MANIAIKSLQTHEQIIQAIEVQKKAWNRDDYSLIPPTMFKSFIKNSGCVLGAFDLDKDLIVGYVIGFLAQNKNGQLYHHSQQVAVLPEYQMQGVAYKLKTAQKDFVVINQKLTVMTWTVDPLLAKNAFLNFHKLGAIGRIYWDDYYGQRNDTLNKGLQTDRIEVEWYFGSQYASLIENTRNLLSKHLPKYQILKFDYNGYSVNNLLNIINTESEILVELPIDFVAVKEKDQIFGRTLRLTFRECFKLLLKNKFSIIDCTRSKEPGFSLLLTNKISNLKPLKIID